ncbi:hypothetical protein Y697_00140 [Mesotoga sp. BH458_6_3_2_1]|nr:hypothetical protein Y697_00140 [Mesotoga sp. BH458_6_3_2_1]
METALHSGQRLFSSAAELAARSAMVLMFCINCVFWLFLPLLAVTGLSLKLRLAPRSGTGEGEAFTGGDDSRLLTGLRSRLAVLTSHRLD